MTIIDKYSYSSKIAETQVWQKLLFAGLPLLICLFANSLGISITVIIIMATSTIYWTQMKASQYLKLIGLPLGFILVGVAAIVVGDIEAGQKDILASISFMGSSFGISKTSLWEGALIVVRTLAAVSCFYCLTLNTPINSFLNFLRRLGLADLLIDLTELIYRFIFVVWEEAKRIYTAQAARLGYRSISSSVKSLGELTTMLFVNCFKRVDRINNALNSRCFDGSLAYHYQEHEPGRKIILHGVLLNTILVSIFLMERLV